MSHIVPVWKAWSQAGLNGDGGAFQRQGLGGGPWVMAGCALERECGIWDLPVISPLLSGSGGGQFAVPTLPERWPLQKPKCDHEVKIRDLSSGVTIPVTEFESVLNLRGVTTGS
jgi:hypothetical protein